MQGRRAFAKVEHVDQIGLVVGRVDEGGAGCDRACFKGTAGTEIGLFGESRQIDDGQIPRIVRDVGTITSGIDLDIRGQRLHANPGHQGF